MPTTSDLSMRQQDLLNERIKKRLAPVDHFALLEAAYIEDSTTLQSPQIKRLYLRFFERMALSVHVIESVGQRLLEESVRSKLEAAIAQRIQKAAHGIDVKLAEAKTLLDAHGITRVAKYLAPMEVQVRLTSSAMSSFLEVLTKADQLFGMINTLRIHKVIDNNRALLEEKMVRTLIIKPPAVARTWEMLVWKSKSRGTPAATSVQSATTTVTESPPATKPTRVRPPKRPSGAKNGRPDARQSNGTSNGASPPHLVDSYVSSEVPTLVPTAQAHDVVIPVMAAEP
jgi:hypothetical protein